MESYFSQSRLIWEPKQPRHTSVDTFRRTINLKHGLNLKDVHELHRYSVEDYTFWEDLWNYVGIIHSVPPQKVITDGPMKEIPTWFPGARLNFAENLLFHQHDAVACTAIRETGTVEHYTFRELRRLVREMAAALRANGLKIGDRVAAIVTNHITALVVCLAAASIGAVFSSTAPDMGIQGILDRYKQIKPKFIFFETEVVYAGKTVDLLPKAIPVAQELRSLGLEKVILLPSAKTGREVQASQVPHSVTLSAFLASDDGRALVFEQLPFNHPLFILYSSGTSGPPKCIVHSAGVRSSFTFILRTWADIIINIISIGARIILYDGSPFAPSLKTFLKIISDQNVTMFGTGPRFLAEVKGQGINPLKLASFESLRVLFVTGAVLTPPMFEWAQQAFGNRIHLISGSGGTDICSGFVSGVATLPVYAGELQGKSLGMKVEVFDPEGNSIEDTGEAGELVCTRPHPSLPIAFWGDPSGEKLRKAYFERYPGIWHQGDFIVKNPSTKGFIFLGRSDGVLNPSGVRMGSSEIYTILENFSNVLDDSLCVGQRRPEDKDERVLLFLKMRPGENFTPDLEKKIREEIRRSLSPRHVPSFIFQIEDIPYTVNNKKIEIAVKQIVSGSTLKPSGTVANPSALQLYYKYRHLEKLLDPIRAQAREKAKL
ncbi:hypothetical protein NLI96_g4244 [Meripilus lineatus]|uniref:Uncharacterized protein n=1 Tax=Meripilus lineatus TaxID=2056292 RepID=A0AAD5V4Z4_9APHY|nr:hypothetical protein NLI96_g4244 [Physisporinus lineatus]